MNTIEFRISPSSTSNDHQTRVFIDGEDWLGDDTLGIDPPEFFVQRELFDGGKALVGRCDCGCVGCCDHHVEVSIREDEVSWESEHGYTLSFARSEYLHELESKSKDHSWEDSNRMAERTLSAILGGTVTTDGYVFDWASTRCTKGMVTLSFSRKGTQQLKEFDWDFEDIDRLEKDALKLKEELVEPVVPYNSGQSLRD